jgi:hypothetical protein
MRILKHLFSYALYQFGDRVAEKTYHERGNGENIGNWNADVFVPYL